MVALVDTRAVDVFVLNRLEEVSEITGVDGGVKFLALLVFILSGSVSD